MNWFPLHVHSYYSLLDGIMSPSTIANRCTDLGLSGCAITDHGSLSACVEFVKAMEQNNLKWILGTELYLCSGEASDKSINNRKLSHLVLLAKNEQGWQDLININNISNQIDHFYYKPRVHLSELKGRGHNIIAFSGHPGSDLGNLFFTDYNLAYNANTYEEAKQYINSNWQNIITAKIMEYKNIFNNFYLEIQLIDQEYMPAQILIAKGLRYLGNKLNIPCVATADSHYAKPNDAFDQRVILCTALQTTLNKVSKNIDSGEIGLKGFFKSHNYHMPSVDEMRKIHTEHELQASIDISNMCEQYTIFSEPQLPTIFCPDNMSELEYLKSICRIGWTNKILYNVPKDQHKKYVDRLLTEFGIIDKANLAGYFLIIQDIIEKFKREGNVLGAGRGSVGGSLVAYLCDITCVDPIKHDLIFSRFFNEGRIAKGHISLPDIDCDFPKAVREDVINYLKSKYGDYCVSHISTFGAMKGRGAIKDVLRAHEACSFDEMNNITQYIPDESKIADKLQELEDAGEETSIIRWALDNNADKLRDWCFIDEQGNLQGKFSKLFEQAIRLEGCKRSRGKHAAGIIISPNTLIHTCPMVYDKEAKDTICALDFNSLEAMGFVKIDILGISLLDKLKGINILLQKGDLNNDG